MMSEGRNALTLLELNRLVSETLTLDMPDEYWVEAELSDMRERGGHCYMELLQTDDHSHTPVAKASAICWGNKWTFIKSHFERVAGQHIHSGMKMLLRVYANFHEAYGFSWIVTDVDATFTLGDMARKRREIIARLQEQGVLDLQKDLQLPMFARRIAVISSGGAAGYGDFCDQLHVNDYGFKFITELFEATMQGENVEQSVIAALNAIYQRANDFDVVVIIRGGGATTDLSGFDTLALAENVSNFPLPIITGIGHERDESILDIVSNTRVKTPTAAATLLIDNLADVWGVLDDCSNRIINYVSNRMDKERMRLTVLPDKLKSLFLIMRTRQEARLDATSVRLTTAMTRSLTEATHHITVLNDEIIPYVKRKISDENQRLSALAQRMEVINPERLLSRGYSITLHNGHSVRDAATLKKGDQIVTKMNKGTVKSIVE